jgi:hypothetical protein
MIASQISNRIGNDIASKCAQGDKASQCEQPRSGSETHRFHLLTSMIASVKRKQLSLQGRFAKSQCVGYHRNRAEAHSGAGNHRTQQQSKEWIKHTGGNGYAQRVVDKREK